MCTDLISETDVWTGTLKQAESFFYDFLQFLAKDDDFLEMTLNPSQKVVPGFRRDFTP